MAWARDCRRRPVPVQRPCAARGRSRHPRAQGRADRVAPSDCRADKRADVRLAGAAAVGHRRAAPPKGSVVRFRAPDFWAITSGRSPGPSVCCSARVCSLARCSSSGAAAGGPRRGLSRPNGVTAPSRISPADWKYWARPDGSFAYISPSCLAITGHDAAAFTSGPALLTEIIVDDDRPNWAGASPCAARRPRRRSGWSSGSGRRAGETRWIDHVCTPVVGQDGANLGIRGSNRDITERKRSEEDLRARVRGDPATARPARGRQHVHAGATAAGGRHRGHSRDQRRHAVCRVEGAAGGAHVEHRAAAGGDRRRQGARRAGDSQREPPPGPPARQAELRRAAGVPHRERALRPRERARSPAPRLSGAAGSRSPTAARCSSTRSANCRSTFRPSCCAPSRTANSSASGAM